MIDTFEPLWVRPKAAAVMLDCGVTKVYGLIETGELESCLDGSARKISVQSIKTLVARMLEAQRGQRIREERGSRVAGRRAADRRDAGGEPRRPRAPRPPRVASSDPEQAEGVGHGDAPVP